MRPGWGAATAAAAALALLPGCGGGAREPVAAHAEAHNKVLPFIEDDYNAALAQARERKLPLFIDVWAPW